MQSKKRQPLQINLHVHAKAEHFDFKFKATSISPSTKPSPFPLNLNLNLKLRPSLIQEKKSDSQLPDPGKPKPLKSKFIRILGKFRPRPSKKADSAKQTSNLRNPEAHFHGNQPRLFAYEEPICISSIVVGFIALMSQSIYRRDQRGIIIGCLRFLLCHALKFIKLISMRNVLVILVAATLGYANGGNFSNILKISEGFVSDCISKAVNFLCNYYVPLPR